MHTLRQALLTLALGGPLLALGCANPLDVAHVEGGTSTATSASNEGVAIRVPTAAALGIAVSGNIAYVSEPFNNTVARLDLTTNTIAARVSVGSLPCFVVFNAAGTTAYVANQFSDNVSIIDVATGTQTAVIPVVGDPLPVAISTDGRTLFTFNEFRFAAFPWMRGRAPELDATDARQLLGRSLARVHQIGALRPFVSRPHRGLQRLGIDACNQVLASDLLPDVLRDR